VEIFNFRASCRMRQRPVIEKILHSHLIRVVYFIKTDMSDTFRHKILGKYKRNKTRDIEKISHFLNHKNNPEPNCWYCDVELRNRVYKKKKEELIKKIDED
jgi:5'-3' exonuclease